MAEKKNSNSNSNNNNLKFLINAQFLKDLSFENPQAPDSLRNIKEIRHLALMPMLNQDLLKIMVRMFMK